MLHYKLQVVKYSPHVSSPNEVKCLKMFRASWLKAYKDTIFCRTDMGRGKSDCRNGINIKAALMIYEGKNHIEEFTMVS